MIPNINKQVLIWLISMGLFFHYFLTIRSMRLICALVGYEES